MTNRTKTFKRTYLTATAQPVTEQELKTLLQTSDTPILVDVWADWCGPCHMQAPILDDFAETCGNTIKIVKLEADTARDFMREYHIMNIPTMILFKNGTPVDTAVGLHTKQQLDTLIQKHVTPHTPS